MTDRTIDHVADIELLTSCEGPAEHAPGVLFEVSKSADSSDTVGAGKLGGEPVLTEFAAWVAQIGLSALIGNAAYDAIKAKMRGVLTAWRRRKGPEWLDDLKQHVFEEISEALAPLKDILHLPGQTGTSPYGSSATMVPQIGAVDPAALHDSLKQLLSHTDLHL